MVIPYVVVAIDVEPIQERFSTVAPFLDERGRRLVAAAVGGRREDDVEIVDWQQIGLAGA